MSLLFLAKMPLVMIPLKTCKAATPFYLCFQAESMRNATVKGIGMAKRKVLKQRDEEGESKKDKVECIKFFNVSDSCDTDMKVQNTDRFFKKYRRVFFSNKNRQVFVTSIESGDTRYSNFGFSLQ